MWGWSRKWALFFAQFHIARDTYPERFVSLLPSNGRTVPGQPRFHSYLLIYRLFDLIPRLSPTESQTRQTLAEWESHSRKMKARAEEVRSIRILNKETGQKLEQWPGLTNFLRITGSYGEQSTNGSTIIIPRQPMCGQTTSAERSTESSEKSKDIRSFAKVFR